MNDKPLYFHSSISELLESFKFSILSIFWLQASNKNISSYFKKYPYICTLACSVTSDEVKIDKSLLKMIENIEQAKQTPIQPSALINLYRIFTIAVKDLIWNHSDFSMLKKRNELQFLRHIRNGSAHNNRFYWGKGTERERIVKSFPINWRGKRIEEKIEGQKVFFDFLAPGDIMVLLSDISKLIAKK